MISSMTAFARKKLEADWGSVTWELRSVNHRYLEMNIRLPEFLRGNEKEARDLIQKNIKRGKIEAILSYTSGKELPYDFTLNEPLIAKLSATAQKLDHYFPKTKVDLMSLLSWNGVLQVKETNNDVIAKAVIEILRQSLTELIATRNREGAMLSAYLDERVLKMESWMQKIKEALPNALKKQREKIHAQFSELQLTVDKDRFEQEILWLAQKADIAEELSRLEIHSKEVRHTLKSAQEAGRRLDFLMQELNREANTIASKSIDPHISQAAVEMKLLIDQMREQVQNIE